MAPVVAPDRNFQMYHRMDPMASVSFLAIGIKGTHRPT